jgi:hypothetical protein
MDTLWYGDVDIRALYNGYSKGPQAQRNILPGYIPVRFTIPVHPYLVADVATAKEHALVPATRDANGGVLVALGENHVVQVAPVQSVGHGTTAVSPVPAVLSVPAVSSIPAVSPIPAVSAVAENPYHFDFWPPQPWDEDPDTSGIPSLKVMGEGEPAAFNQYLRGKPLMWKEDETDWHGARCFPTGGYGSAGLWCRVNRENNITEVCASFSLLDYQWTRF